MLWSERLLQVLELDVLVADFSVARSIEAGRCPEVQLRTQIRFLMSDKPSGCIPCECEFHSLEFILALLKHAV